MSDDSHTIDYRKRYLALSRLAVAGARGEAVALLLKSAVAEAVEQVGLIAGSVRIFGEGEDDQARAMAGSETGQGRLNELESTLLGQLRRNYSVRSLFMTLDLDGPAGLFSYPLKFGDTILGAISGVARGERNLASEEQFVASIAAMVVLLGRATGAWTAPAVETKATASSEDSIKTKAVLETAAAINHEINNPLMAVMGNVELLLRRGEEIDAASRDKLTKIHEAATRIRQVTQDLMKISSARTTPYPGGSSMIDIKGSPKRDDT